MGIRSMVAAAVVALGSGQAAEAAVYRYGVTYQDTWFQSVDISVVTPEDPPYESTVYRYANLRASEDPYGMPLYHPSLRPGQEYVFHLDYDGQRLNSCWLGPINCFVSSGYEQFITLEPIVIGDGPALTELRFTAMTLGSTVSYGDAYIHGFGFIEGGGYWTGAAYNRYTTFTLTSDLTPVPLPAGALLLPVGLAGLALIRRRQQA